MTIPNPAAAFWPVRSHGLIYCEVYDLGFAAISRTVGWITRASFAVPYECWYCDGHRFAKVTRGSQKNARAWIVAQSLLPSPPLPARKQLVPLKPVSHLVYATREGLVGDKTASGYVIDTVVSFVALPCEKALRRFVRVRANYKSTIAQVLDVGPWLEHDDAYVLGADAPLAASGWHTVDGQVVKGVTNGAGIDLGQAVLTALGMTDNGTVEWEFV